jgi:uncharacterized membrane protein YqiK
MIEEIIVLIFVAILLFIFIVKGLALIHDDEVGILTKKMFGRKLPQGRIISRDGEIGVQADIVMPRLLWRNPITWKIEKAPVVEIKPGEIGIVESIDGDPLPVGRLLADAVECNSYQDAKKFLENGGKKIATGSYHLTRRRNRCPGRYRNASITLEKSDHLEN